MWITHAEPATHGILYMKRHPDGKISIPATGGWLRARQVGKGGNEAVRVAVTGSTGLIGRALMKALRSGGHDAVPIVRGEKGADDSAITWDPARGRLLADDLTGLDAVVHLAGENIGAGRWSPRRKEAIRDSRLGTTALLARALCAIEKPPGVWICASAVGYYGDRGEEMLTEESPGGTGFLADLCRNWEGATQLAANRDIRVVNCRFGLVLNKDEGALAKMLPPFRFGAGGPLGSGRQYMSWITLDDAVNAIVHAMVTDSMRGPVNVTAPDPVTNWDFSRILGRVLRRPAFTPAPAFALRALFGEMADALLLSSTRVLPQKLLDSGFQFAHGSLEDALRHVLDRGA